MNAKLVKRYNAIGWDWFLVSDECESWVSHDVKEHIGALEAENAKLRQQLADVTESMGRVEKRCAKLREYATKLEQANIALDSDNYDLKNDMKDMQFFIDENRKLRLLAEGMATYERMDTDADPLRALEIKGAIRQLASELGVEVGG